MSMSAGPMGALLDPPMVDPRWVQSVLAGCGAIAPGVRLDGVRFEGYIGTGQLGRSARFALDWAEPDGQPASVVAKIPGMQPEVTGPLFDSGMYDAEIAFYNEVQPYVEVAHPRCFHAFGSREDLLFVILMEDLADYGAGDQLAGITVENLAHAVEQAAALHGPSWGDPALARLACFAGRDPAGPEHAADSYCEYIPAVLERLGGRLSDDAISTVERFGDVVHRWVQRDTGTPHTVVHGDFRPDNLLLADNSDGARPLIVVDWQTMGLGAGATDIAYLLGGALETPDRARVEDDLLRTYLGLLHQRYRLTDYTEPELRRDYALGTLAGLIVAVTATIRAIRTPRGDDLFTLMIERHAAHAREHNAIELAAG